MNKTNKGIEKTNRLKEIREWLGKSREFLANDYPKGKSGEFYLLIAVELLTRYLEVDRKEIKK